MNDDSAATNDALQSDNDSQAGYREAVDVFSDWALIGKDEGMERGHANAVQEMLTFAISKVAGLGNKFSAIDVGCGNGWVARQLLMMPGCEAAVGIDGSESMIAKAKEIDPTGEYHLALLPDWQPKQRFNLLHSMEFLYYLKDPASMLKAFAENWLEEGGWAVIGIDHYQENTESLDWPEAVGVHMTTFSEQQWLAHWQEAGFTNITHWRADTKQNEDGSTTPGTLVIAGMKPSTA